MQSPSPFYFTALIISVLFFGTFSVLTIKWQYDVCIIMGTESMAKTLECPDGGRRYDKPWAQNWLMFAGEVWVLFVYRVQRTLSDKRRQRLGKPPRRFDDASPWVFAIPALCDTLGSGLSSVGMLIVPAAVYQMMRSSNVAFTAILSVGYLKKTLYGYHWIGVATTMLGLGFVGCAAILDGDDSEKNSPVAWTKMAFGLGVIVFGQIANAFQGVFEEHLLQGRKLSAKRTLGMEGFWGLVFMTVLLGVFSYIPGNDHGVFEDFSDTARMFANSGQLVWISVADVACVGLCNLSCLMVTKQISAVTRCLVDSCRTVVIWLVSLGLFYTGYPRWGTPWTPNSWIQLLGFFLIVLGTLMYNAVIHLPGFSYPRLFNQEPLIAAMSPKMAMLAGKGMNDFDLSPPCSPVTSPSLNEYLLDDEECDEEDKETMMVVGNSEF
eukprot:TRINITY_DN54865_c0_g1_i1.p1 TRINITY_DN54865_c0_g1~~TRINITY_DN54865_c0_g1_i1.p1  ORF type:complete len:436 (+),score=43.10 TRINITY_DN54865_c0_g1_i1:103-1410(+)